MFGEFVSAAIALSAAMVAITLYPLTVLKKQKKDGLAFWMMGKYKTEWVRWYCDAFDTLFGKNHLTLKCFRRSAVFSIGSVILICILMVFQNPILPTRAISAISLAEIILVTVTVNVFADYFSLLETRYILGSLQKVQSLVVQALIMLVDLVFSALLIFAALFVYTYLKTGDAVPFSLLLGSFSYYSIFFYSTFVTSIWAWMFFFATIIGRITSLGVLVEYIDYEKYAPRILAAFVGAATFVFVFAATEVSTPDEDGRSLWNRSICRAFQDITCSLSADLASDPKAKLYVLNRKCFVNSNCSERAAREIEESCLSGENLSCVLLAQLYRDGDSLSRDVKKAAELSEVACTGGNADGCSWIGYAYREGEGVPRDPAKAAEFFQAACDGRDAWSCEALGVLYREGEGVPRNLVKAADLFRSGCDQGDTGSCSWLGFSYREGEGVPRDPAKASRFLRTACDSGGAWACQALGNLYRDGQGVLADPAKAAELFQDACNKGDARGCGQIGYLYREGEGVSVDLEKAAELFAVGCDGGDLKSCASLGVLYRDGEGVPHDPFKATQLFKMACDSGDTDGCWLLGLSHRVGDGVARDREKAADLYKIACDLRDAKACISLGQAYFFGQGVERDPTKATELFQIACDLGNATGCGALGRPQPSVSLPVIEWE